MSPMHTLNALRPAHEARAAVVWAIALGHGLLLTAVLHLPRAAALALVGLCAGMGLWRLHQACTVWRFKLALRATAAAPLPCHRFEQRRADLQGALWLGWGYRWQPEHTQLCHDVLKRPMHALDPPAWFARLAGRAPPPSDTKGLAWVHGLSAERDVVVPFAALEGHTAVLAITGALKTVLARLLVYQLASRGDTVIVLDPKGDRGLESVCRDVTERLGRPDRFLKFHPAFASRSFRYDAIANWERETQVASRLQLLMGAQADDHFAAFIWMSVTDIVRAMKRAGRRPTLASLLRLLRSPEAGEALAEELLQAFFAEAGIEPAGAGSGVSAGDGALRGRRAAPDGPARSPFTSHRLARWVRQFREQVPAERRPSDITGLLAALETNREWFAKMVVGLTPILTRLTAGDLGALLSPDHTDLHDPRPVYTARTLIEGRHVVYFGLDALSDTSVAESLAALVLADLAGTAGEAYNRAAADAALPKVHVVCDEWGDLVCEPIIQLANKGRGVGIVLYLFGQTVSDLVVKLGDPGRAKRVLGNMNNFIVGATSDTDTLDFMARKFGDTVVRRTTVSQGTGQKTEDTGLEFAATRQTSVTEQAHELVPSQVLMGLPDLQYFAIVNRAQVFKGRIPVLTFDDPAPSEAKASDRDPRTGPLARRDGDRVLAGSRAGRGPLFSPLAVWARARRASAAGRRR